MYILIYGVKTRNLMKGTAENNQKHREGIILDFGLPDYNYALIMQQRRMKLMNELERIVKVELASTLCKTRGRKKRVPSRLCLS